MAQINKPNEYFNTVLYAGNGTTQSVTGVNFQPDFSWLKCRSTAYNHRLYDSVRGALKNLVSNSTSAEATADNGLSAFNSDGFTVTEGGDAYNSSGQTYVGWNWLAGGTASSNTDGSITSTVSANTTSGFSIVSYTGTETNATIGHGLGVAPSVVICKARSDTSDWQMYHASLGATQLIKLNLTDATLTNAIWQDTAPTNNVFYVGASPSINGSGETNIAYCFAEKKGFSKFGSYTGNGNADGTFVYTGFSPAFVIIKRSSGIASWNIKDNKRNNASTSFNINPRNATLLPNTSDADQDANALDFLSNGFKNKSTGNDVNASGNTYIYMAFAENPLVGTNNIPTTAR